MGSGADTLTCWHEAAIGTDPTREWGTIRGRWRGDSSEQGLAGADQPDDLVPCPGACRVHSSGTPWRDPGRDGLGRHPPLRVPATRRALRFMGGTGVFARCDAGGGACPPEDCGGPESFMAACDDRFSFDALEDLRLKADLCPSPSSPQPGRGISHGAMLVQILRSSRRMTAWVNV